jgi:fibro-slime domain-containing protein
VEDIFINGCLVIDLGAIQTQETGTVELDAQTSALDISTDVPYELAIFNAECHTWRTAKMSRAQSTETPFAHGRG